MEAPMSHTRPLALLAALVAVAAPAILFNIRLNKLC
jgi:hypothetical protein